MVVVFPVVEALEVVAVMEVEGGLHLGHFMEHPDLCETQKEPNMAMAAEVDMAGDKSFFQISFILVSHPYLGILLLSIHCDGVVAIPRSN